MPKTIVHKVVFKNAARKDLYELYMNAKKHSEATGEKAKIFRQGGKRLFRRQWLDHGQKSPARKGQAYRPIVAGKRLEQK